MTNEVQKTKRLPNQHPFTPPAYVRPSKLTDDGTPNGYGRPVVPVSMVAREWGISARRVRAMLVEGRLEGRQLDNGYWEVHYPFRYMFGRRGPSLKCQQKQKRTPE